MATEWEGQSAQWNIGSQNSISIKHSEELWENEKKKIKIFIRSAIRDYAVQNNLGSRIGEVLTSDLTKKFMDRIFHLLDTTSADTSILSVDSVWNLWLSQSRDWGNEVSFESYDIQREIFLVQNSSSNGGDFLSRNNDP